VKNLWSQAENKGPLLVPSPAQSDLLTTYLAKRDMLRHFLIAQLRDREEAEDVLQDLFMKVRAVGDSAALNSPASYLFKMAINLAFDRRRARRRAKVREADWGGVLRISAGPETAADAPSAEASYGAKQRLAAVRAALEDLSPQCRRAFLLHKFEGLSHQEVAERAGISRSTVEKHMNTALKHLSRKLGRD